MTPRYSLAQVAKVLGLPERQLKQWERTGLLRPSLTEGGVRYYSAQDMLGLRTAKGLLDSGLSLKKVRGAVEALRARLPDLEQPLGQLCIQVRGSDVVVAEAGQLVEATTGQLVLNFEVGAFLSQVQSIVQGLSEAPASEVPPEPQDARGWFQKGLASEPDAPAAMTAYERALALDSRHVAAHVNLGALLYERKDFVQALEHFRAALDLEPDHLLALYNSGNALDELGQREEAAEAYRRALDVEPDYADAHYNLARVYEKLGKQAEAHAHWREYLKLDPDGRWARFAQSRLQG